MEFESSVRSARFLDAPIIEALEKIGRELERANDLKEADVQVTKSTTENESTVRSRRFLDAPIIEALEKIGCELERANDLKGTDVQVTKSTAVKSKEEEEKTAKTEPETPRTSEATNDIVHCCECVHYDTSYSHRMDASCHRCGLTKRGCRDNDYCSFGKKKNIAVPQIVHCGECVHWDTSRPSTHNPAYHGCKVIDCECCAEDFCSVGYKEKNND